MFCDHCGKIVPDNASVCDGCGKPTASGRPPVAAAVPPYLSPDGQAQPHSQAQGFAPPYQQPAAGYGYQPPYLPPRSEPLSVGDFAIIMIISAIPLVNLIMLLVWAFGSDVNVNRQNYARASLLLMVICLGLVFLFAGCAVAVGMLR